MKLTDEKLLELCAKFGRAALDTRGKFIGLLPEVNRRRLYEKHGCRSIFEFAAKLAGVSEEQVRVALRLERRFEDKPALHALLVEGRVSVNKLVRVASIATPENAMELAGKVRVLPRAALETLVRDEHVWQRDFDKENGYPKPLFETKTVPVQTFQLSEEVVEELNQLQEQGQDVNAILLKLLKQRRQNIQEEKAQIAEDIQPAASRYVPVRIRRVVQEEFGKKCSIATCQKLSMEIHHTQRFSLGRSHDPHFLAPLCSEHHQLAHAVDLKVQAHWS